MNLGKKLEQYGVLFVGLLIGGGFAFGGIASYSGIVSGGGSSNDNNQANQFNATLPSSNFKVGSYGLTPQEQGVLAYNKDVVFFTGFYQDQKTLNQLKTFQSLPKKFDNRVYIQVVNSSETTFDERLGITNNTKGVVLGRRTRGRAMAVQSLSQQNVVNSVCQAIGTLGPALATQC